MASMVVTRLMLAGLALSLVGFLPTAAIGAAAAQSGAQSGAQSPPSGADIQIRDRLIADQEALLNVYRCRFGIDAHAVPGGCRGARPARPAREPALFTGPPTPSDLAARDELAAAQEALLNVYRCRFGIDAHAVPGGCTDGAPARIQERVSVAAGPASGRCAQAIASGLQDWERCAWEGFWDNRNHNPSLADAEAQALVERIWAEVDVEGKPASPPTTELAPEGANCATAVEEGVVVACYQHSRHRIRRLDPFLHTLLHETAHALVALHPSVQACRSRSNPRDYDACAHNDIFRCVADHLFVRYAGIPSAGVCGRAEQQYIPPDDADAWASTELDSGGRIAGIAAYTHNRRFPYSDSDDWLFVRCAGGRLEVLLSFERGTVAGQRLYADRVPVAHAFLPGAFFSWDEAQQNSFTDSNRVRRLWGESAGNSAVFLPTRDQESFVNAAANAGSAWLMAAVEDWDGTDFGVFFFGLDSASAHVRPATEACGWTWQ